MKHVREIHLERPSLRQIELELERRKNKRANRGWMIKTLCALAVVAVLVFCLNRFLLPGYVVEGSSMSETLQAQDRVIACKHLPVARGDIVAIQYEDCIVLKRVIGIAHDRIAIEDDGVVRVNGALLDEPYATKSTEETHACEYTVPDGYFFVLGDNRDHSIDSRVESFGMIHEDQIQAKALLRIWPLNRLEILTNHMGDENNAR